MTYLSCQKSISVNHDKIFSFSLLKISKTINNELKQKLEFAVIKVEQLSLTNISNPTNFKWCDSCFFSKGQNRFPSSKNVLDKEHYCIFLFSYRRGRGIMIWFNKGCKILKTKYIKYKMTVSFRSYFNKLSIKTRWITINTID